MSDPDPLSKEERQIRGIIKASEGLLAIMSSMNKFTIEEPHFRPDGMILKIKCRPQRGKKSRKHRARMDKK